MSLKNPLTPTGIDHRTVRLVAQCLNHYATPGPKSNECQKYFLGAKGGRCVWLTSLPPLYADCTESGSLNLLEPSGHVQVCNGIALHS